MFLATEGSSEIKPGDLETFQAGEVNVGTCSELVEGLAELAAGHSVMVVTGQLEVADLETEVERGGKTEEGGTRTLKV